MLVALGEVGPLDQGWFQGFPRTWDPLDWWAGPILFPWLQGIPMGIVWVAGCPRSCRSLKFFGATLDPGSQQGPKPPTRTISWERWWNKNTLGVVMGPGSRVDSHEVWVWRVFLAVSAQKWVGFGSRSNGAFARNWATRFSCHSAGTAGGRDRVMASARVLQAPVMEPYIRG